MTELLKDHKNYIVFKYFQEICHIPHGSGNTSKLRDYIVSLAKEHELEYVAEPAGNVIVIREATEGNNNSAPIMLQAHIDMVCEKESSSSHDFENDPLEIYEEDGFLKAKDTTLGGDDGIGVAYMLALLTDPDYAGPRIDCVFTVDEETGMLGINSLDFSKIRARRMINLDSENEGVFTAGCAGGVHVCGSLPIHHEDVSGFKTDIVVSGLVGGHSGDEINKGRGNAMQLLSRFLYKIETSGCDYHLISVNGGNKINAIPREATASVVITSSPVRISDLAEDFRKNIVHELEDSDPDVTINVYEAGKEAVHRAMDNSVKEAFFLITYAMPNGIMRLSRTIKGLPETSVNMGIVQTNKGTIECNYLLRSSIASRKTELLERMTLILKAAKAGITISGDYPAWEFSKDSPLREGMAALWEKMYGKAPQVTAIHGGLECGIISSKCSEMDIVAIGPDIKDIHTPKERLDIESASRVYDFLVTFLKECK